MAIEKMKKLTLLIYHSSKEDFLINLQKLGAVHLEINEAVHTSEVSFFKEEITRIEKIKKFLLSLKKPSDKNAETLKSEDDADVVASEIEAEKEIIEEYHFEAQLLKKEITALEPWEEFDPEIIEKLEQNGVKIKFYSIPAVKFEKLDKTGLYIEKISEKNGNINFIIISEDQSDINESGISEEKIPLKKISFLHERLVFLNTEIKKQEKKLTEYTAYLPMLEDKITGLKNRLSFEIADSNLIPELKGNIQIIKGWIPLRILKKIENFLKNEDAAYILEEPSKDDVIPILLRNNPFGKLFEPLMKIFSLPAYTEIDTTVFLAPFYAMFFGICSSDVGYGAVLFAVTIFLFFFIKNKTLKPLILLGMFLSVMTITGGILYNTFFGFEIIKEFVEKHKILPESFKKIVIFSNQSDAMFFALMLGIIQVLLGFVLKTYNKIRNGGIQAGFYSVGTFMFLLGVSIVAVSTLGSGFKIGPIPVGKLIFLIPSPLVSGIAMAASGIALIMFFNNIDKKIYIRPLFGIWEIYGLITGIPGDILSYLRLFALGLSGGLLGGAINQIAFMVRGDGSSVFGIFFMILILIFGHSINCALSFLGSFVHPLRLTFVEFYKSVGFTGGGIEFKPFCNLDRK